MKSDYPVEGFPKIDIIVPDEFLENRDEPARLLIIQECLYYINGISKAIMLIGDEGVTCSEGNIQNAIECLGSLNNQFNAIAFHHLDMFFIEQFKEARND